MDEWTDRIICGDNLVVVPEMPDESIDLMTTDPPFGMSFMGKEWDKALPPVAIWKECLRVLKPGAFASVMCIPRQDCLSRMIINLEDAGFMVNFSPIYHTFATGFPKAANISKLVDKRMGAEREVVGVVEDPHNVMGRMQRALKAAGQRKYTKGISEDLVNQKYGGYPITAPASPEAKALDGAFAGYQPKPAVEVVLVAMKPLSEKTYIDQALANGKGVTWLGDGRIPYKKGDNIEAKNPHTVGYIGKHGIYGKSEPIEYQLPDGRFAPNLLVSDDVLNDGVERKSGGKQGAQYYSDDRWFPDSRGYATTHSDSGSFSRYFSLDAWAEKHLPESVRRTFPFMIVPKPSPKEKHSGLDGKNTHPTCKPIQLMSYLITIGSRPGDIILDPFCGSGTTAIAAAILDRRYIGIELDAEYCNIAEKRIAWHVEEAKKEAASQPDLFEVAGD
jgi:site-specific DNA-methyltransferase (adenine-specific)